MQLAVRTGSKAQCATERGSLMRPKRVLERAQYTNQIQAVTESRIHTHTGTHRRAHTTMCERRTNDDDRV